MSISIAFAGRTRSSSLFARPMCGPRKVFTADTLRADHVLASTCLPMLMHAVEIDGEYYWDGGYAGNPALFPLVYECESRDIVMVHITPADRAEVPTTSLGIMNRMQEISFNTSLIREMRGIFRQQADRRG